jgi:polyhydroxyalkanoate synthesis regulator phasin
MSPEDHPEFMKYLEEVVQGIKSTKEWEQVAEHKGGLALENLSHGQQSAVTALQHLYTEVQISGKISNDQAAQYWNDLEKLHQQVKNHQESQEERITEALRQEGARRSVVEGEIAEEVTRIRTDMQEFVNKQLPGWLQEGVTSGLRNLPQPPLALTLEQIREVIRAEQTPTNPNADKIAQEQRERVRQKEKDIFEQWMKEMTQKAEEAMEERLAEQAKRMKAANKPTTIGEGETNREERLSRWASQVPPNLRELPPSPSLLSEYNPPPPPSPPRRQKHQAPPSSSSSSSSLSSSDKGRHHRSWSKGPKGRKGEKYFFKVKAPCMKERPF